MRVAAVDLYLARVPSYMLDQSLLGEAVLTALRLQ